jgi:hypothetical protein
MFVLPRRVVGLALQKFCQSGEWWGTRELACVGHGPSRRRAAAAAAACITP